VAGKRRKKQRARRPPLQGVPLAPVSDGADPAVDAPVTAAPAPRPQAPSRFATSVSTARRGGAAAAVATIDIDERVPNFGKDMRRLLVTAAIMVAIIIVASFFLH
jgi:hypothetical protein